MIDKICPFMSRPIITTGGEHIGLARILCLEEKCMAWVEDCPEYKKDDPRECHPEDCEMENRDYKRCKGGCRLI